jgi:ATP/maltotriose-dependent transcriptional regulator MalT/DNA-binding SARP family transcriptional activator
MSPPAARLAKLTRPRPRNAVVRERLFRLFDAQREHSCIWLSGPPGAGKTMLVASYCEHRRLPGIWYQVDAGDADPSTFFYYLTAAAGHLAPKKRPLPLLTAEYLQDVAGFARRYFRELYARLPRSAVLVLDNFQEVPHGGSFQQLVAIAIAEIPPGVTAIVASRGDPPEAFARQLASETLARVGWDALRLTLDEAAAIARARGARDDALVRALHHRAGGWAAGMTLLLEQVDRGPAPRSPEEVSHEAVFDYFASQVFADASARTRQVLIRTSLLGSFSLAMAESISDDTNCRALLERLCDRQLFTFRKAGREPSYQYHDLFGAFLRRKLESSCGPAELTALHRRAAALLVAAGRDAEAVPLLASARDWRSASEVVLRAASSLLAQGRWKTLEEWIDRLPADVSEGEPWLQYWLGLARMQVDLVGARRILRRAFDAFVQEQHAVGQLLCAPAAIRTIYFEYEDFARMDEWVSHVERLLGANPTFPDPGAELSVHSAMLLAATYRQPAHPLLPLCRERVAQLLDADIDVNQRLSAAIALLSHFSIAADFLAGEPLIERISPLLDAAELTALNRTYWWLYAGYHYYLLGKRAQCEAAFERCQRIALESGLAQAEAVLRSMRCYHYQMWNDERAGEELQALKRAMTPSRHMDVAQYHLACMRMAVQRSNGESAIQHAEAGLAAATCIGSPFFDVVWRLNGAVGLIAGGAFERAQRWIDEAQRSARTTFLERFDALASLLRSVLAHARGDAQAEAECMRAALAEGRKDLADRYFRWALNLKDAALVRALERRSDLAYVQRLIREFEVPPPAQPPEDWPWPVRIFTLGAFRIELDGRPLTFAHKAPRKPIALLKAVVALGGRNIPEPRLWDALWPGEDGGAAHEAFAVALHRLRKLLARHDAIVLQEGQVSLDFAQCWVDALETDALLAGIEAEHPAPPAAAASRLWRIYRGAFLPEDQDAPWSISMRERLRSRFLRCVARSARHLLECGDVEAAADLYRRGIETDDLAEELYQGLMLCLTRLERRAEAAAVFRGLRRTLSVTLGVQPSPQSERLYRAVQTEQAGPVWNSVPNR